MPGPKLRYDDGKVEDQDSWITLRDIRISYPNCYLIHGNLAHRSDGFVLQDDVTYELRLANVGNGGKY